MITNYGNLAIEIDPRTGTARMVGSGVSGTRPRDPRKSAGSRPASPPIDEYDSKLEAARAHYLGMLVLAKDVRKVVHHPFPVQVAPTRSYMPDFLVWWTDGRITVEEVKGSIKQKNARDSITRLHVAAGLFPMFTWQLVRRIRGQWETRCIPTST